MEPKHKTVTVKLPRDAVDIARESAAKEERTITAWIVRAIRKAGGEKVEPEKPSK